MGISERRHRQKQVLRERILEASRAIVTRDGFAALSMRKIAEAVEYSPAALYLHFESRDDIARALRAQGHAQLLASLAPHGQVAEPRARLRAIAQAYVAFGLANRETYRLIFMEDPSYAELGAVHGEMGEPQTHAEGSSDATLVLLTNAIEALKAAGRVSAPAQSRVWAEAIWATLHGIVALTLTCPVYSRSPVEQLVDTAIGAWFDGRLPPASARTQASRRARRALPAASETAPPKRGRKASA
jgi:AcrR family transcriptional regulator